ncbi:LysR family transcriptional regulator [Microbacterium betulae]|uniref:LysR family transcriptional regulator n=1 Tax=Microbacterium betulae TaxID=2981139 RepID=A0AA97I799_9MICO|nr:LysR family transcriptional regulator [Microbacterium sp. AB]WOF24027.1 LysR family transcriptional regulator [Microbacterium sp. AB]
MSRRPEITLTQLHYFVAAAEHLSMTEAARDFFVAQSAVSAAIAQLEQLLGAQLFIRQRAKGIVLTPAGLQFLGDVRALLLSLDGALDAARGIDNQVRGTVRIACFITLAPFLLPEVISRARSRHPYLDIAVDEVDAEEGRDLVRAGRIELLVGYDFALGEDIRRETIVEAPPHIILPVGHPLAGHDRIFLRELSREKLILLDLPYSRDYFLRILHSAGLEPDVRHRSRSYETVRSLVAHGHGFSVLNQRPAHALTYDGFEVSAIPIADDAPALQVVLASLRDVRQSARARAVAGIIREVARELFDGKRARGTGTPG